MTELGLEREIDHLAIGFDLGISGGYVGAGAKRERLILVGESLQCRKRRLGELIVVRIEPDFEITLTPQGGQGFGQNVPDAFFTYLEFLLQNLLGHQDRQAHAVLFGVVGHLLAELGKLFENRLHTFQIDPGLLVAALHTFLLTCFQPFEPRLLQNIVDLFLSVRDHLFRFLLRRFLHLPGFFVTGLRLLVQLIDFLAHLRHVELGLLTNAGRVLIRVAEQGILALELDRREIRCIGIALLAVRLLARELGTRAHPWRNLPQ